VSVTERLMAAGQWTLGLDPATPYATRQLLDFFGHVYVFDSPMRTGLSDATMIAASRWGGVVRTHPTPFALGGANMITWLGDEDGKGPIWETAKTGTTATFATFIGLLLPTSVTSGTLGAVAGTRTATYQWVTPRAAIDNVCALFGAEYRVNKDATFDAAAINTGVIFKTTPTAVAYKKSSGRDQSITGISVTQLDVLADVEEYFTRSLVQDATGAWTGDSSGGIVFRSIGTDSDGTLNAWTQVAGVWTIASNLVSSPTTASALIVAGSSAWRDLTYWLRFKWTTGTAPNAVIHCDGTVANFIIGQLTSTTLSLQKMVGSVLTSVATAALSPVNGTFYWFKITAVGTGYEVDIYSDVSGHASSLLATCNGVVADAGVQSGMIGIRTAVGVTVSTTHGGAFINVVTVATPTNYKDLLGNTLQMTKPTISTITSAANAAGLAASIIATTGLRQEITLSTDEYDIDRDVVVGDWIWVYDADGGLVDTTNPVRYRGSIIYPAKVRVLAITWPIERGMSVWYRDKAGVWTNLTNYVEFEAPGATFEVGAPIRALTKS
jgi:hypothetical protein